MRWFGQLSHLDILRELNHGQPEILGGARQSIKATLAVDDGILYIGTAKALYNTADFNRCGNRQIKPYALHKVGSLSCQIRKKTFTCKRRGTNNIAQKRQ